MEKPSIHPQASDDRSPEILDLDEVIALEAVVHGAVQGVGFRYWCWCQAEELGLTGSATNNDDGTVTVVAEGPRRAVGDFLKSLISRDTPGAVITVDEHFGPPTGQYTEFSTH